MGEPPGSPWFELSRRLSESPPRSNWLAEPGGKGLQPIRESFLAPPVAAPRKQLLQDRGFLVTCIDDLAGHPQTGSAVGVACSGLTSDYERPAWK